MKLHLNLADIGSSLDTDRPTSHHFVSSRATLKKGLDINVVQSCLDTLDVFRDLLYGIPHQKNRVVRDVCKNIILTQYQQRDVIYDVGEKANAVYFCLSGNVSICILKQVPKQASNQAHIQFQTTTQKTSRLQPLNTPKTPHGNSNILTIPTISTTNNTQIQQQNQLQKVDQEIDCVESGQGFGQAEFIAQTKRTVKAIAKNTHTLVGKLQIQHFTEVLQNYRQKVYYKKRDMFQKCPLFANLPPVKLQFIINNMKPMTINISHKLVKQGSPVDIVYLVNKGQVSIWKTGIQIDKQFNAESDDQQQLKRVKTEESYLNSKNSSKQKMPVSSQPQKDYQQNQQEQNSKTFQQQKPQHNKVYSSLLKLKKMKCPIPKQENYKVFMGLLSEGCFIGDMELAIGSPYQFNAICKTEKAEVYYCDRRIILSQMTQQNLDQASKYYYQKESYLKGKIKKYKNAKQRIHKQKQIDLLPPLTKDQIQLKRKLMHRYVQQKNSLIGQSSPSDIQKMIKRKQQRVIRQPEVSKFPILQLFPNHSVKKRSQSPMLSPRSFNPLAIVQVPGRKCITQFDQYVPQKQPLSPKNRQKLPSISLNTSPQKSTEHNNSMLLNPQNINKQKLHNSVSIQACKKARSQSETQQLSSLKSIIIKIKPSKLDLSDLKHGQQKNMAIVNKIIGRYRRCDNRFHSISQIINKIQNNRI